MQPQSLWRYNRLQRHQPAGTARIFITYCVNVLKTAPTSIPGILSGLIVCSPPWRQRSALYLQYDNSDHTTKYSTRIHQRPVRVGSRSSNGILPLPSSKQICIENKNPGPRIPPIWGGWNLSASRVPKNTQFSTTYDPLERYRGSPFYHTTCQEHLNWIWSPYLVLDSWRQRRCRRFTSTRVFMGSHASGWTMTLSYLTDRTVGRSTALCTQQYTAQVPPISDSILSGSSLMGSESLHQRYSAQPVGMIVYGRWKHVPTSFDLSRSIDQK